MVSTQPGAQEALRKEVGGGGDVRWACSFCVRTADLPAGFQRCGLDGAGEAGVVNVLTAHGPRAVTPRTLVHRFPQAGRGEGVGLGSWCPWRAGPGEGRLRLG